MSKKNDTNKTVLNVKTDKEVKEEAQKLAKELGVPLSTVVNGYLRQFIRDREVTFSAAPRMSKQLEDTIAEAEEDIANGDLIGPFESGEEMDEYLKSMAQ